MSDTASRVNSAEPPFRAIRDAIERYSTFGIVAHVGPDGDAIGSGLALRFALESLGKDAWVISNDNVPPSCRFLPQWKSVVPSPPVQPQCLFILDCDGTNGRVAAPYHLVERTRFKVMIDHHRTSQAIFDVNWIDPSQPATALMIYRLLQDMRIPVTADMAQCMLCGMSTDTGNFRFPNTTPDCLRAAGDLVEFGADPAEVAFKLFDERSFGATRLLGMALNKMQTECDGDLIWTALTAVDFDTSGAGDEGSENVVNFLRNVRGARMALILRERFDETGTVARVSVRCDPEMRADLFSQQFGGGGHAAAAGFRVSHKSFTDNVAFVVQSACKWIAQDHPPVSDTTS